METTTKTWLIGGDLPIRRVGYGAMRLSAQSGNFVTDSDWEGGKRLLRRAVELGVNFIDTAHPYGPGWNWNEQLIADALAPYPPGLIVTTKGGVEKTGSDKIFSDGTPASLRRFCAGSLRRLKLDRIELYQLHRPDPKVPFATSVEALAELRFEGKIRHVGLSNVTLAQIKEARQIVPIASVQNRYNLAERTDDPVVDYCAQHGIAYLPWGPLAAKPFAPEAPLAKASGLVAQIAQELGTTTGQVALAWLLRRSPNIVLIPGTTSIPHLEENIAAGKVDLSDAQFAALCTN
jgi:aryl-alcohol dehydrogenase-like predicted oxidoreductase